MREIPAVILGDMGVALVRFTIGKLGLIFREKPTLDFGIDGEIEIVENGRATGRLVAVQIKCGRSYFASSSETHISYRVSGVHFQYWTKHSLPVIVVLVDHELLQCFWAKIDPEQMERAGKSYKLAIPKHQTLDEGAIQSISAIATPLITQDKFAVAEQSLEELGSLRLASYTVMLAPSTDRWSKAGVEQVARQVTAEARSESIWELPEDQMVAGEKRRINVTVLGHTAAGTPTNVARIEGTHDTSATSLSDYWHWQFDWNEAFFREMDGPRVSGEGERYLARVAGPLLLARLILEFLERHGRDVGGSYGKWVARDLTQLIDGFGDLAARPQPADCHLLHQNVTDMLLSADHCRTLALSEGDWDGNLPSLTKHHVAGNALLEEARQQSHKACAELQRLSQLVTS